MTRRVRLAGLLITLTVAGTALTAARRDDWRAIMTVKDRKQLREWRSAWVAGLADARSGGGAATIAADPVLFDPDAALVDDGLPPAGDYRCRHIGLGTRAIGPALAIEPWGRCRIEESETRQLVDLDGARRTSGQLYPDTDRHAMFLGTTMLGDERRPPTYGHAAGRDIAGTMERIGDRRWRLVLPYPRLGGTLDLIELRPAP